MVNNKPFIPLLVLFHFLLGACDVMDSTKLKIYNDSRDTIFCLVATEQNFNTYTYSPLDQAKEYNGKDTVLVKSNNILFPSDSSVFSSYDWRYDVKSSKLKKLNVFIFLYNTLKSNNWDDLKRDTAYHTKFSLTIDELDSKNWQIEYKGKYTITNPQ